MNSRTLDELLKMETTIYMSLGILLTALYFPDHGYSLGTTVIEGDVYVHVFASIYTKMDDNGTCYDIDTESFQNVEAIRWTLNEINKAFKDDGNKGIGLRVSETCKSVVRAEQLAFQLVREMSISITKDVIGVMGGDYSDETVKIARLLNSVPAQYRLPVVSYRATATTLNNNELTNFLRTIPSDLIQTKIMLKFMKSLNWTYLAIVHSNDTYGIEGSKTLQENFKDMDICFPVTIAFDKSQSEVWLETKLHNNVYNASVPVGGVVVFGDAVLANTVVQVTENIRRRYPDSSRPVMLFSDGGMNTEVNSTYDIYGTFSLSPPRRNTTKFINYFKSQLMNQHGLLNMTDTYSVWMEAYISKIGLNLSTKVPSGASVTIDAANLIVPSIYNQFAIQATLTLARIEQIVRSNICLTRTFCSELFRIPRNEYAKRTRHLTVNVNDFQRVHLNELIYTDEGQFTVKFSNSCEAEVPDTDPKYEVYQNQAGHNTTIQVQVAYLTNKLILNKTRIKDYDSQGNERSWPDIRKPQCPDNHTCLLCLNNNIYPSVSILEYGDLYIVGVVPVHNRGSSPLECGSIKPGTLDIVEAMRFAIGEAELNFADKIPDAKVGLIVIDSCNDAHIIQEKMMILHRNGLFHNGRYISLTDKILGYIGGFSSDSSATMADICARIGCVQISYASTSTSLSSRTTYPNFLRVPGSDDQQTGAIVKILKELGTNVIQLVHSDTVYGNSGKQALQEKVLIEEICIAKAHKYKHVSKTSIDALFQSLLRIKDVKTIVIYLSSFDVDEIRDDLNRLTDSTGFVFIFSDGWGKRGDISTYQNMVGSITLLPEIRVSEKFEEHMKYLKPDGSNLNPWIRPYMEDVFKCYYQWNYNKSAGYECTGKESLDVFKTEYRIDAWAPFAERATLSLLQGTRRALDQLCESSNYMCEDFTQRPEMVIAELKKTTHGDDNTSVFDDNGDGLAGFTFYAMVPKYGKIVYKKIGSSMPDFVFYKSYRELNISGSRCTDQEICSTCPRTAHSGSSDQTTVYPVWFLGLFTLVSLICVSVTTYLVFTVCKRGCCVQIYNGRLRSVEGYLTPADMKRASRTNNKRSQELDSGHYLSLSECVEHDYRSSNTVHLNGRANPSVDTNLGDSTGYLPMTTNLDRGRSSETPLNACLSNKQASVYVQVHRNTKANAPESKEACNHMSVITNICAPSERTNANDRTSTTHKGDAQIPKNCDQTPTKPRLCCQQAVSESQMMGARGSDTTKLDNYEVFSDISYDLNESPRSHSSYILGNIPASISSYTQMFGSGQPEINEEP